ncbi:hypothetical protein ABZ330_30725 [Streptomyces sp. NPDC006172]|uniref:hypothetical protein n=1 Tax=Streptomyces sp. NPDC006172 TaxID=3154470 RepID=UPI0033DB0146
MADMPDLRTDAPKKKGDWAAQVRSLPRWQGVLAVLPLGLLFVGGLIGGLIGGLGLVTNLKIARSALTPALKGLSMVGVIIGAALTYLLIAAVLTAAS